MGVFTFEEEHTSTHPPAKLFKAFLLDGDNLFPKVAPHAAKGAEIIQGNGGVGTIKKVNFGEASGFSYVVHKIEEIDEANFIYKYSVIEGDALGDNIEKIKHEIKLVEGPNGGTIVKEVSYVYPKGDHQIDGEKVKEGKQNINKLFQLADAYLKEHPELYN